LLIQVAWDEDDPAGFDLGLGDAYLGGGGIREAGSQDQGQQQRADTVHSKLLVS
jgi:hypothetical protein